MVRDLGAYLFFLLFGENLLEFAESNSVQKIHAKVDNFCLSTSSVLRELATKIFFTKTTLQDLCLIVLRNQSSDHHSQLFASEISDSLKFSLEAGEELTLFLEEESNCSNLINPPVPEKKIERDCSFLRQLQTVLKNRNSSIFIMDILRNLDCFVGDISLSELYLEITVLGVLLFQILEAKVEKTLFLLNQVTTF